MSFFDDASLAFLPSSGAGKDGKAYSIKPTTGAGDFTFSRGSNLSATRVGPTGLIEKGRENLLTYSNQFDIDWGKSNTSVTGGQSGYDGSSDAWSLNVIPAATQHILTKTISLSGVYTFSFYLKAGTLNSILMYLIGPNQGVRFNISTKSFISYEGGGSNIVGYDIEDLPNGWARYSITSAVAMSSARIYLLDNLGNSVFTGSASDNIYIQDANWKSALPLRITLNRERQRERRDC